MKKKLFIIIPIAIIVLIQFFTIDTHNPEFNVKNDFIEVTDAPEDIGNTLKNACYDCHSYQTEYPWYVHVAPVSWWMDSHIKEARRHVNFSKWGEYSTEKQNSKIEAIIEEIQSKDMPLKSYTLMHSDARLSSQTRKMLVDWLSHSGQSEGAQK